MHEKMNEPIEVEAVFLQHKVIPRSFASRGHVYHIKSVGMIHHAYQGREKVYYFSVSDNTNFFRLAFFTDSMKWRLEEIYSE